jgi:UDP-glucose 4-epimerase
MVAELQRQACQCVVADSLETGFESSLGAGVELVVARVGSDEVAALVRDGQFDVIFQFAGLIAVGESALMPMRYYANNVGEMAALLAVLESMPSKRPALVFSSSAAVYGEPKQVPIPETHPKAPASPYGQSKWMVEQMLQDAHRAFGLRFAALRYFNAAGASADGTRGERHDPETHLIPLALQVASGRRASLSVFGTDYDTPDGTCVRDYVHVEDLCAAHWLAARALLGGAPSMALNLGTGRGYSILEVIEAVKRITGRQLVYRFEPRRAGDPSALVADPSLARETLAWRAARSELNTIVAHAWAWEEKYPWR